jgi:hypothetical protein
MKIKTHGTITLPVVFYGCLVFYTEGEKWAKGVREKGAEEDTCA